MVWCSRPWVSFGVIWHSVSRRMPFTKSAKYVPRRLLRRGATEMRAGCEVTEIDLSRSELSLWLHTSGSNGLY